MKRISYRDYHESMGTLFDLGEESVFEKRKKPGCVRVSYDYLLLHHTQLLKKGEPYYILCTKGIHSRRAVAILEYYGYDVTQVVLE